MKSRLVIWKIGLLVLLLTALWGKQAAAVSYGKSVAWLNGLGTNGIAAYSVGSTKAIYWATKEDTKEVDSWIIRGETYFQNYTGNTLYYNAAASVNYSYLIGDGITLYAGGGGGGNYPNSSPIIAVSITRSGDLYSTFDYINLAINNSSTMQWVNAYKKRSPTGTATVNSGQTLVTNYLFRQTGNNYQSGVYTVQVNSGGTWAMNSMVAMGDHNEDDALAGFGGDFYLKGDGGLVVVSKDDSVGTGQIEMNGSGGGGKVYIQLGGSSTIRIESNCRLRNGGWNGGDSGVSWTSNYANIDNNGEFQFWDGTNHVYAGAISGSGTFYPGSGTGHEFIIGRNNAGGTFSGTIQGAVKVIKEGSGTQELLTTGNNFTDGLVINGGTIRFYCEHGNETVRSLGTGTITMANGTEIWAYHNSSDDAATNVHSVTQDVNMTGAQGTLRSGHGNFLQFTGKVTGTRVNIASDSGYVVFNNASNSFSTLHIGNGLNNWTDATIYSAARVVMTNNNVLSGALVEFEHISGPLGVNYLDMNGYSATIAGLSADANSKAYSEVKNGGSGTSTLTLNVGATRAYYGLISGAIKLVKTGSSEQQLFNTGNTFSGGIDVQGGFIGFFCNANVTENVGSLGSTTARITLSNNAMIRSISDAEETTARANVQTVNNPITVSGAGSLRSGYSKYLKLAGAVSASGATLSIASDSGFISFANSSNTIGTLQIGSGFANWENSASAARVILDANNALGGALVRFQMHSASTGGNYLEMNGYSATAAGLTSGTADASYATVKNSTGSSTLTLNVESQLFYYGNITGNLKIVKTGSNGQYFANDTTYSGGTVIQQGILAVHTSGGFGSGDITLDGGAMHNWSASFAVTNNIKMGANGGSLRGYGEQTFTLSGQITDGVTGAGSLCIDADSGIIVISGTNNTYTGGTKIGEKFTAGGNNVGFLKLSGNGRHLGTGVVSFSQGGTYLDLNGSREDGIGGLSSTFADSSVKNTGSANSLTLNVASGNSYSFGGVIQDGVSLVKSGAGTQTLTGANTYTGSTTVSSGTLKINGSGTIGTTGNVVVNNGTLEFETSASMNISAARWYIATESNENAVVNLKSGNLTFTTGHYDTYIGGGLNSDAMLTNSTGTLNQTGGTIGTSSSNDHWINIGEWGTGIYNLSGGSVACTYFCVGRRGVGTLNLSGNGTVTSNNFVVGGDYGNTPVTTSGTVNQTGGTVNTPALVFGTNAVQADSSASTTTAIYNLAGGVLNLTGGFRAANGTHTHEMHISDTGQLALDTTSAISGLAFTMAGTGGGTGAVLFKKTTAINNAVTLTGDTTVGVEDSITGTMSGAISGSGKALTKVGDGMLVLSGAGSTYSGGTTIAAGTLKLGAAGAVTTNTAMAIASGCTFDLNGFDQTLSMLTGSGSGAGTVTNTQSGTTSTLIVSNASLDTYAGMVSESGTGKIHLVKQNTDKLEMKAAVAFSGGLDVTGGTLLFSGAANIDSSVSVTGSSTLIFSGNSVVGGTVNVTNGTLQMGNNTVGGQIGSGSIALGASGTLKLQYLLGRTFTNAISGSGTIVQNSGGTISLSSNLDSFTGAVSVLKGTLNTTRAFTASTIDISGGTLKNSLVTLNAGSTTVSGGTLNLDGGGLVSDVTVTSGTLKLNGSTLTGDVFLRGGNYSLKDCTLNGDFIAYDGVTLPILQSGVTITGTIYRGVDSVGSLSTNDAGGAFYFDEGTTLQLTMPSGSQAVEPEDLSLVSFSEMAPASAEVLSVTSLKQLSTGDVVTTDEAVALTKLALNDGMTLDLTVTDRPTVTESGWADLLTTTDGIVGDASAFDTLTLNFGANSVSYTGDLSSFLQVNGNRLQINSLRVLDEYNTAVPEPSTWLLLVLGAFGLTTYTRRRSARNMA